MTSIRSNWMLALVLGSSLAIAAAAVAADAPSGTPPDGSAKTSRFQQKLGLTDDQMKAIREVNGRYAENRKQLGQSLRQKQQELRQLALNGGDPAAIQAKSQEVAQLLSQNLAMRVQSLQEISPLLTQEQRDKLAQMSPAMHWHRRGGPQQQGT
jgi:Spy/CpxP family protein refolding chaperone